MQSGGDMLRWLIAQLGLLGGLWKGKVEQGFKLLSERSLQSLKHTCHLRIRLGGGYLVAKVRKIGETLLSSLPNFFEIEARRSAIFSNQCHLLWRGILVWIAGCGRGGLVVAGGGGCWSVGLRVYHSGLQYRSTLNAKANELVESSK
jgi:hypothetical protein